jgi:hypothetical protein
MKSQRKTQPTIFLHFRINWMLKAYLHNSMKNTIVCKLRSRDLHIQRDELIKIPDIELLLFSPKRQAEAKAFFFIFSFDQGTTSSFKKPLSMIATPEFY